LEARLGVFQNHVLRCKLKHIQGVPVMRSLSIWVLDWYIFRWMHSINSQH
jgi:hypothetical protein